jgi:hypothetical protein
MTRPNRNRSRLMLGCASAAMALALGVAPEEAAAQGIQADNATVFGTASVTTVGNETTIEVSTPTATIDWSPIEDVNGDALDFLPTGSTAIFQDAPGQGGFAVLNRILPATNGNITVIDGAVISRLQDATGNFTPGGFVAFYSPTGLLIGDNASFDVGRLLLTTLDIDPLNFEFFATQSATLALNGAAGSTARIQINPGATITATPENAFFAVVAADIEMRGTARINGSHAYVAGEVVNLSFFNGLFNITVPVGTAAAGEVLTVDGTVGGPSSTGALGDNHLIYGVIRAANDPISMLFSGNLGFDTAAVAGVVNGEIILAANHDVFGRFVDGGSVDAGINAVFNGNSALTTVRGDIFIEDVTATSSLLARGAHRVRAVATGANMSVDGNLLLAGSENAELVATNGRSVTITGDLLVDATDFGLSGSTLQSLAEANAQGGAALVDVGPGSTLAITGGALINASAVAGVDESVPASGTGQGGSAIVNVNGGTVTVGTDLSLLAVGIANGGNFGPLGGTAIGGQARISGAGAATISSGSITINSNAETATGGTARAGTSTLELAGSSTAAISAANIGLFADAFGADFGALGNTAGRFRVSVTGGNINGGSVFLSAFGDVLPSPATPSELIANGGDINITSSLSAQALGNIDIRTGNGGVIGATPGPAARNIIQIISDGTVTITGDSDTTAGLGAEFISIGARELDILAGARIGAISAFISARDDTATAFLGGTVEEAGFTLTAAELGRFSVDELSIAVPGVVGSNNPNQPDLVIRDLTLDGSASGGPGFVSIFAGIDFPDGLVRIEGTLNYSGVGVDDELRIEAGRIELVTPGGIRVTDTAGAPGGLLTMAATDIWAADAATIDLLQTGDLTPAERDALLATAAAGSADPLGYIRAGGVAFEVGNSLLVRNTGNLAIGGGILVGSGGLSISLSPIQQPGTVIDVFAYGQRQISAFSFVSGDAFFSEVNFNRVAPGSTLYLDASAFNDCVINTGVCPDRPPPPTLVPPEIFNPVIFEPPLTIGDEPPAAQGEDDERFGIDFPERPEDPLISEDPLLDDPVTSGSDASLYGAAATPPAGGK